MLALDSSRTNTALARRAARRFLQASCPWDDVNDVLLVVSELLGNAVRHTEGAWLLRMSCRREGLVVEVHDSSRTSRRRGPATRRPARCPPTTVMRAGSPRPSLRPGRAAVHGTQALMQVLPAAGLSAPITLMLLPHRLIGT
ncbi:ATP-binding protein [Streptomyces sp. NPDC085639]|uniref:ATP-binding protein n=1 Tax=Streptomyces sp. NPDC085639 TaxID=3365734 RepID=UPI0037D4076A